MFNAFYIVYRGPGLIRARRGFRAPCLSPALLALPWTLLMLATSKSIPLLLAPRNSAPATPASRAIPRAVCQLNNSLEKESSAPVLAFALCSGSGR